MSLTQEQLNEILKAMRGTALDKELIEMIEDILKLHCGNGSTPMTSYDSIKNYCQNYITTLKASGKGLVPTNYEDEMMLVYMDKASVASVMTSTPTDGYVAGIMGVYENASAQTQLTISLLPADRNLNFMQDGNGNYLPGEQCWKQIDVVENFDTVFK